MESKQAQTDEEETVSDPCAGALQKLANFCHSYDPAEIDDLLGRLLVAVVGGSYYRMNAISKERLLNYFEALEEVLPAIHTINSHLSSLSKFNDEAIYENSVAYRRLFASLKRHPE